MWLGLCKPLFFVEQRMLAYDHKDCTRLTTKIGLARAQESTSETTKCTRS